MQNCNLVYIICMLCRYKKGGCPPWPFLYLSSHRGNNLIPMKFWAPFHKELWLIVWLISIVTQWPFVYQAILWLIITLCETGPWSHHLYLFCFQRGIWIDPEKWKRNSCSLRVRMEREVEEPMESREPDILDEQTGHVEHSEERGQQEPDNASLGWVDAFTCIDK